MCGIAGIVRIDSKPIPHMARYLDVMSELIAHRGPDASRTWLSHDETVGFAHRRLSIFDLSENGAQPMHGPNGTTLVFNGAIYNFVELRQQFTRKWTFKGQSDTETILSAYEKYGTDCIEHLRGMFAFSIWDEKQKKLFCARDRFGIKPFYYTVIDGSFYFASEIKAFMPFLPDIETDTSAFTEYLTFQYTIGEQTLFKGVKELLPGHTLVIENDVIKVRRYWDVRYDPDFDHSAKYFTEQIKEILDESVRLHLRSDIPVGAYVSGGVDSSLIGLLAAQHSKVNRLSFNGRFTEFPGYDESDYAQIVAKRMGGQLHIVDITAEDFKKHIREVIYHLDSPVAGPGSFPQYMVSKLASEHVKVALGGQGGDEIFGGYARYLLAYLEQCIKAAMDGTYQNGNFIVTIESIVPNLGLLREYKPMMRQFWKEGMFSSLDARYFRLIDRSADMIDEVNWSELDKEAVFENFQAIFNNDDNVRKESYFDCMTRFDFKCLLPALLHVEDRMSMAHGLESRVPLLDHAIVEFAATIPADIKFKGGQMKRMLKSAYQNFIPEQVLMRRDKMGFPVPMQEWFSGDLNGWVRDVFTVAKGKNRPFINTDHVLENICSENLFSRKIWGFLSLELWHQEFHDKVGYYRKMRP